MRNFGTFAGKIDNLNCSLRTFFSGKGRKYCRESLTKHTFQYSTWSSNVLNQIGGKCWDVHSQNCGKLCGVFNEENSVPKKKVLVYRPIFKDTIVFDLLLLHYLLLNSPKKSKLGIQGTSLERSKIWESRLLFQLHLSPVSKCDLQKPCSVSKDKENDFCEFICSKNSIKKQLVVPEYHTFLIVFTRTAPNVFSLSVTLTTVSWKRLCTKQIDTKLATA